MLKGKEKREGMGLNFSSIVCKDTRRIDSDFKMDESEFSLSKLGQAGTKALEMEKSAGKVLSMSTNAYGLITKACLLNVLNFNGTMRDAIWVNLTII